MNIAYGGLAIIICLALSEKFARSAYTNNTMMLASFVATFLSINALGGLFWCFDWGFLSNIDSASVFLKDVSGLAGFLALLVALKCLNKRKRMALEEMEP